MSDNIDFNHPIVEAAGVNCAWCGEAIDPRDNSTYFSYRRHETGQVDYVCSLRCEMRHRCYTEQCECGWYHSNKNCPKCGKISKGEEMARKQHEEWLKSLTPEERERYEIGMDDF